MENSTRDNKKIALAYVIIIGLVVTTLYCSIEFSGWFYLLALPAVFLLVLMFYFHTLAIKGVEKGFVEKWQEERARKKNDERELKKKSDFEAFMEVTYLSDGEHHHFPKLIHQSLINKGLMSGSANRWYWESELLEVLHLNVLNLEWFEELESVRYNCVGGAFHGPCVQFFSWGKAVLNFSAGKLDGRQEVICDEKLVLEMTFKGGKLFYAEDKAIPDIQIRITVVGDVFKYSIETPIELISFETLAGRPKFSMRRLSKTPDDLAFWRYSTPIGKVNITNTRNAEAIEIEMGLDSARISATRGESSSSAIDKQFWSPLAFLYYDFRYVVGRYNRFELIYDNGYRGPPGFGVGRKDYPSPLRGYDELLV